MRQQRITRYISCVREGKSAQTQPCYFLRLPSQIRCKIYREAGLHSEPFLDLNLSASLGKSVSLDDAIDASRLAIIPDVEPIYDKNDRVVVHTEALPLSLLFVCRTVHAEVEKLLYENGTFVIMRR